MEAVVVDDVEQTVGIRVEEFGGVVAATCSSWSTQVMLVGTSTESIRRSPQSLAAGIWLTQTKQRRRGARSCSLGLALVLLQYTHCPSVEENGFPPCCIRARGSSPHQAFTRWARAKQQAGKGSLWQQVEQNVGTSPSQALSPQHTARPEHTAGPHLTWSISPASCHPMGRLCTETWLRASLHHGCCHRGAGPALSSTSGPWGRSCCTLTAARSTQSAQEEDGHLHTSIPLLPHCWKRRYIRPEHHRALLGGLFAMEQSHDKAEAQEGFPMAALEWLHAANSSKPSQSFQAQLCPGASARTGVGRPQSLPATSGLRSRPSISLSIWLQRAE